MVNTTIVDGLIFAQANWAGMWWTTTVMDILIFLVCMPMLYRDRHKPKIHYRCWTLYSMTVVFVIINKVCNSLMATPGYVTSATYPAVRIIGDVGIYLVFPSFHAIFLRQWFLTQRPKIQQELATIPVNDVSKYEMLTRNLKWNRFWSSTKGTWSMWGMHVIVLLAIVLGFYISSFDSQQQLKGNMSNMYCLVSTIVTAVEPISAIVLMFFIIPFKSADNFNIGWQLHLVTYVMAVNVFLAIITNSVSSGSPIMQSIGSWNGGFVPVIISAIVLIIPVLPDRLNAALETAISGDSSANTSQIKSSNPSSQVGEMSQMSSQPGSQAGTPDRIMKKTRIPKSKTRSELEMILATPAKLALFKEFMAKEFCLENVLFCIAMENYRTRVGEAKDYKTRLALAKAIAAEYVLPGSANELNLVSTEVKIIKDKLKQCEQESAENAIILFELYDHADEHVRELIEKNNLRRFHHVK